MTAPDSGDRGDPVGYDDPIAVAREIVGLTDPTLLVLDCDGVLAPLVDHADDSVLLGGIAEALAVLARGGDGRAERAAEDATRLRPAIVSGRSLAGLEQFDFPDGIIVVGSYGGERRGRDDEALTSAEAARLDRLRNAAVRGAEAAGEGAWVESKPASVVLHVRQAEPDAGRRALAELERVAGEIDGADVHHGSNVLELMARPSDKGTAVGHLRDIEAPGSTVYVGDDVPDEDAFAVLGESDLAIKVGPGDTVASRRLRDPAAVRALLRHLAELPPLD